MNHGGEAKSPKVIGQSDGWHRDTRVDGFQSYTHRQMTHEFMRENDGLYLKDRDATQTRGVISK